MGILISVLSVLFVILCVLLIIIVLLQSDKSAGMGILGGSSQSAFGSSTADVITKITAVMVGLFMLGSLGLAVLESQRTEMMKKMISDDADSAQVDEKKKKPEETPAMGEEKDAAHNSSEKQE